MTVAGRFGASPQTRRRRAAPGRCGSGRVSAVLAAAGCDACDGDDGGVGGCEDGGGVGGGGGRRMADHCGGAGWILSAGRCRWSRGSPVRSSYHSPGPPDQRHPLGETQIE